MSQLEVDAARQFGVQFEGQRSKRGRRWRAQSGACVTLTCCAHHCSSKRLSFLNMLYIYGVLKWPQGGSSLELICSHSSTMSQLEHSWRICKADYCFASFTHLPSLLCFQRVDSICFHDSSEEEISLSLKPSDLLLLPWPPHKLHLLDEVRSWARVDYVGGKTVSHAIIREAVNDFPSWAGA